MVTLRTFANQAEASLIKSFLDDCEIPCALADESSSLYTPIGTVPFRIVVPEEYYAQALEMLDSFEKATPPAEEA